MYSSNRRKVSAVIALTILVLALLPGCTPAAPAPSATEAPTESVSKEYEAGTLVFSTDGVASFYGEYNQVTKTYTGWDTEQYIYYDVPWDGIKYKIVRVIIEEGVSPAYTDCWFLSCSNLVDITIPNSVTNIGSQAFFGCDKLSTIVIPDGVTSIGYMAFANCDELTTVVISDSVTRIGDSAFSHCKKLTSVTISNNLTSISQSMFEQCKSLTSVIIPDSVTSIGNYAFNDCDSLINLTIPDSVTSIGEIVFYSCQNLADLFYEGTMAQWSAIQKSEIWCGGSYIHSVQCSDGTVSWE